MSVLVPFLPLPPFFPHALTHTLLSSLSGINENSDCWLPCEGQVQRSQAILSTPPELSLSRVCSPHTFLPSQRISNPLLRNCLPSQLGRSLTLRSCSPPSSSTPVSMQSPEQHTQAGNKLPSQGQMARAPSPHGIVIPASVSHCVCPPGLCVHRWEGEPTFPSGEIHMTV